MDRLDFRSDTVSWPTPQMRQAMAAAVVGDDVYGEDPTVNALEAEAAQRTGKEAGLFVTSGTMGNLVSLLAHANRGDQVVLGNDAHIFKYEAGGMAALGGIMPKPLPTDAQGRMDPTAVAAAVSPDDPHFPTTRLIALENSYGSKHGYPLPPAYFAQMRAVADTHDLRIHLDGARLFNAAVAQNVAVTEITRHVDSASLCLSKGLCAPVGSVVVGTAEFIDRARRMRKVVGGGMRQAGVLAAAGLIALREMTGRLAEDHAHARRLAAGLATMPEIDLSPECVQTNIVFFNLADSVPVTADVVAERMRKRHNVWVGANGPRSFRAVLHYWLGEQEVDQFLAAVQSALSA